MRRYNHDLIAVVYTYVSMHTIMDSARDAVTSPHLKFKCGAWHAGVPCRESRDRLGAGLPSRPITRFFPSVATPDSMLFHTLLPVARIACGHDIVTGFITPTCCLQ